VNADEKLSAFVELERQVLTVTFYLESIHPDRERLGRQILWLSNRQPVFSPSATLFHPSLGSNFHKAQALSERHIDALATQFWVWLRESRIDDPHVTALVQHKRTVLMGRVWGSAVAFAARSQRNRRAERHKRCNEVFLQFPRSQFARESKHAKTSLGCEEKLQSLKFDSARDTERAFVINSTRFPFFEYCPCTEHTVENCGTPTLRFSEAVDFASPFCLRHLVAWPATLQIILKNDAKSSFFKLCCNMFGQRFQKRRIISG
jgi:hypothetical protein